MAAVQFVVLQLILQLLMFWSFDDPLAIAEAQVPIAKYRCRDSCGNVTIPYPFGMEKKGCYIEERFKMHCNSTSGVPTISISGIDMEVTNISIHYHTITVNFPVVYANCEGKESKSSTVVDLEGNPFAFSSAENYFIAKGCHNVALITPKNDDSHPWCVSFCEKERDNGLYMSACTNTTWYLTNIPSGLKVFNVTFKGFDNKAKLGSSNSSQKLGECRCASLIEQTRVDNSVSDMRDVDFVPVVLDWGIDNEIFQSFVERQGCPISTAIHRCGASGPPINSSSRPKSTIQCYSTLIPDDHNPYLDYFCEGNRNGNRTKMATIGVGAGLGTMCSLIGLWRLYKVFKRRRNEKMKKKFFKRNGGLLLQEQLSSGEVNVEKIKMFPSKELKRATDRYNVNRMLGQGGQGTVYKGMLADGKIVAVKKSKILDEEKVKQFINEVVILSQINHRNVVKLLGCCLETEVPLLVYEFIPNGTLFQFLHDPNEELPLTWEMRLRIATDVAGALFYLHSAASSPIYHRDIKSTNILLDEKYRAKVADFGTSRSVTIEQTHVTTRVQGTFGYLDPEYFQSSQFTDKSDVYSFGVVLVELITGKKPVSFSRSEEQATSFVTYFLMAMESNYLFDVLDPQVVEQGKREDVLMVASLAWSCLKLNGKERPTMKEVTMALEGIHKSHDFMVPQEIEIDQNEVIVASWELASTSANSGSNIYAIPSQDSKPFLFTY